MSVENRNSPPAVRTPDPLAGSRRRALERLGQGLRAMGLGAIGDIGSNSFGVVSTITWETATDWDNAIDEAGVVHESIGDVTADDVVRLGFPNNLYSALQAYWHFDDSSFPLEEVVNGLNATDYGGAATLDVPAIAGTTGISLDGTDDEVNAPHNSVLNSRDSGFTVATWFKTSQSNSNRPMMAKWGDGENEWLLAQSHLNDGRIIFTAYDTDNVQAETASTYADGNWHLAIGGYDGSNARIVVDPGSGEDVTGDAGGTLNTTTRDLRFGRYSVTGSDSNYYAGDLDAPMFFDKWLSPTERDGLYAVGSSGAYLTTSTKSFSSNEQPDLSNLTYSLNGQSIGVDVIGSPGEAGEEVVTQTLDGATSYALTWGSGHTNFRLKLNPSTTDPTTTPTFSSGTLTA